MTYPPPGHATVRPALHPNGLPGNTGDPLPTQRFSVTKRIVTVTALMAAMGGISSGVAYAEPVEEVTYAVTGVVDDVNPAPEPTVEMGPWRDYCRSQGGTPKITPDGMCWGPGGV